MQYHNITKDDMLNGDGLRVVLWVAGREAMQRTIRLLDLTFGRSPFFRMRVARRWIRHLARPGRYAGLLNTLPSLSS